jgi:hypothetical protein
MESLEWEVWCRPDICASQNGNDRVSNFMCAGKRVKSGAEQIYTMSKKRSVAFCTKPVFWETHAHTSFNDRLRLMLKKLLNGFEGKLTSSKWATIAKCSQDTALRDILDLVERGVSCQRSWRRAQYQLFFGVAGQRPDKLAR